MAGLDAALAAMEEAIASAQAKANALATALKRARKAAEAGKISELEKALAALHERADAASAEASDLAAQWTFDAKAYLDAGYLKELREAAAAGGLSIHEKDGRLYAFPLALRIEKNDAAVRIGKKIERSIRPAALVKILATAQKRPMRFSEEKFLDLLYKTYVKVTRHDWDKRTSGQGLAIPLIEIHETLTLLPGTDYSLEEFGRDLLLLSRRPELRTRDGASLRFPGSALARRAPPIKVYDEEGRKRAFVGLAFVREG